MRKLMLLGILLVGGCSGVSYLPPPRTAACVQPVLEDFSFSPTTDDQFALQSMQLANQQMQQAAMQQMITTP
jgi:hypothetical protein